MTLLQLLSKRVLNGDKGEVVWVLSSKGTFSIKYFNSHLAKRVGKLMRKFKLIWKANASLMVTIFAWKAARECILTRDKLIRRGKS